ncbi:MAG: hypothetical protein ACRDY3_10510, partial [Acidimicrobiales bacterium]
MEGTSGTSRDPGAAPPGTAPPGASRDPGAAPRARWRLCAVLAARPPGIKKPGRWRRWRPTGMARLERSDARR